MSVEALREGPESLFFPGAVAGKQLSATAMRKVLARMNRGELTVHGFRSTFRDWAAEATNHPREVAEAALAHALRDRTEAAYQRGDLMEKRRRLMDDWAKFCARPAIPQAPTAPTVSEPPRAGTRGGYCRPCPGKEPSGVILRQAQSAGRANSDRLAITSVIISAMTRRRRLPVGFISKQIRPKDCPRPPLLVHRVTHRILPDPGDITVCIHDMQCSKEPGWVLNRSPPPPRRAVNYLRCERPV